MKHKGFSLIELMIYLTVILFLMYHCVPWSSTLLFHYKRHHADAHQMIDCCVLHDLFIKDLFEASCKKSTWAILSASHLIWKKIDGTYVGWMYENNNLYRVTGSFNPLTRQWHKKHTIPVLYGASGLFFQWQSNEEHINSMHLELELHQKHYSFSGVPRYAND